MQLHELKAHRVQPANMDSSTGADLLAAIPILYNNFQPNGGCEGDPAYTSVGLNGQPSRMHFCQENGMNAYAYPDISQIQCANLGNEVSMDMMTLGGSILIHELT